MADKERYITLRQEASAELEVELVKNCRLGAFVNCYLYDKDGYEVATTQLDMKAECEKMPESVGEASIREVENDFIIEGDGFSYTLSKFYGEITSIKKNGVEQLKDSVHLTVMRAPIDNEMFDKKDWYCYENKSFLENRAEGYDRMWNKCYTCERKGNTITVTGSLCGVSRLPFLRYTVDYTFYGDGSVKVVLNGDIREDCKWLPRLGFEFKTLYENNEFRYFGRGEHENYCDMRQHAKIGFYESNADKEYFPYIKPQEHGNHIDTKILDIKNGLKFRSDKGFEFNVSHYGAETLMRAGHIDELKKEDHTVVRIDYKNSGVGSNSCGPSLIEKYRLYANNVNFKFSIKF